MIHTIKTIKKSANAIGIALLLFSFNSCQDFLDVVPQDKLVGDQLYRNVYDADAVVMGIYGKFLKLAEKHVILNELRADLMTTTRNSSPFLKDISEHNVSLNNTYTNPKEYYEVILNCNDALKNFDSMYATKKFTETEYKQRYADIACLRSWVYLQLGIHFGSVPYITEPIETLDDVKNITKYPRISFNELLDKLVTFTESLSYKKVYDPTSSIVVTVDGYSNDKFFINKECLLGDLQLWKGNYLEAAKHYKTVMETATGTTSPYDMYRIKYAEVGTNEDLNVGYIRYQEYDETLLINTSEKGWGSTFTRTRDLLWNTEWIWSIPFDSRFAPTNPFFNLFSKSGGNYLVKPSQLAIESWNSQKQSNGFPYDARGPKYTYNFQGNDPVILKYANVTWSGSVQQNGNFYLYRAAKLHLRYAEAANRDNQTKIVSAILNNGIRDAYDRTPNRLTSTSDDVTNYMQSRDEVTGALLPFPYDFDARNGDYPNFRSPWHRNTGIRGRARLVAVTIDANVIANENNIINEAALELAYEGNRWEDLVRIARRRNDPAFLADKVYAKLSKDGNGNASAVREKLMNMDNWYLPFTW